MTERCLLSLEQQPPDELIIVDSDSPYRLSVGTVIIENGTYTKAVNKGLELAEGDILIIGNNDLIFSPNWLDGLLLPLQLGYDISTVQVVDDGILPEERETITQGDKFGSL